MPRPLPAVLGVCSLAGMALVWRDLSSKLKGENRTLSSLLSQYLAVKAVGWLGRRQRKKLEADTLNVKQVQEETLLKRLSKNANTCYGKQYDFCSIKGKKKNMTVLMDSYWRVGICTSGWCSVTTCTCYKTTSLTHRFVL